MIRLRALIKPCCAALLALTLALFAWAAPVPPAVHAQDPGTVLFLVNQARAGAGLPPLALNGALNAAAARHSNDMASHNHFDHIGTDGSDPATRVSQAGYTWSTVGENIAQTWSFDAGEVVNLWMNSPGHRANILGSGFLRWASPRPRPPTARSTGPRSSPPSRAALRAA